MTCDVPKLSGLLATVGQDVERRLLADLEVLVQVPGLLPIVRQDVERRVLTSVQLIRQILPRSQFAVDMPGGSTIRAGLDITMKVLT